jgi:hypothetical protein
MGATSAPAEDWASRTPLAPASTASSALRSDVKLEIMG